MLTLILLAATANAAEPAFRNVAAIFQQHCAVCHSAPVNAGGLSLENYESAMKGGKSGAVIVPGKAQESRLVKMLDGRLKPEMPQGGPPLDAKTIAIIRAWIDAGAKAPAPGETAAAPAAVAVPDIKPRVPVTSQIASLAFRRDGSLLAAGRYKQVELVDPVSRKVVAALDGHVDVVRSLAFSPDGRLLAAAGGLPARKGELKVWDVEKREAIRTVEAHTDNIYSVAFSPDGKTIATAGYDKIAKLWDAATGQETATLKDHTDGIFVLAFSPDGKRLATGSADRTIKVWDTATGKRLFTLGDSQDNVYSLAWHPAGRQIAAAGADKTLRTWDVGDRDGKQARAITGHEDAVLQVAYSPDGNELVTASADGHIKIWDPELLVEKEVLETQPDWVMAITFSPDGKWLVAGRYDGSLAFYSPHRQEAPKGVLRSQR